MNILTSTNIAWGPQLNLLFICDQRIMMCAICERNLGNSGNSILYNNRWKYAHNTHTHMCLLWNGCSQAMCGLELIVLQLV